eukprot:GAHX01001315.1.p2 GENE.GAHX01001315.1~~GAHX01001315.1.p2  ORF type:complete len:336 (-),score=59.55 GAHX01001315.1:73-1080(-)
MGNIDELSKKRWLFVGGKGGVGKTSSSCAIALALASKTHKVLLISTDPAHNLSDAFGQKFGHLPQKVKDIDNLSCIEIDPSRAVSGLFSSSTGSQLPNSIETGFSAEKTPNKGILRKVLSGFPGIDEAVTFHILMSDKSLDEYDKIVFDTAPTGHTLKFLSLPATLDAGIEEVLKLESSLGPIFSLLKTFTQSTNLANNNEGDPTGDLLDLADGNMFAKLRNIKTSIGEIKKVFTNHELTTFICVSIPEMLSLYETERLIQGVKKHGIGCDMIIINQIISGGSCKTCNVRGKIHKSFIEQFDILYGDEFKLVKIPVMDFEVRGPSNLEKLGEFIN